MIPSNITPESFIAGLKAKTITPNFDDQQNIISFNVQQWDSSQIGMTPARLPDFVFDTPQKEEFDALIAANDATIKATENDLAMLQNRATLLATIEGLYDAAQRPAILAALS